jgi:hypothetical protein
LPITDRTPALVAAAAVGVSHGYVSDAKTIKQEAPDLIEEIKAGKKTQPQAKRELKERKREKKRVPAIAKAMTAHTVAEMSAPAKAPAIDRNKKIRRAIATIRSLKTELAPFDMREVMGALAVAQSGLSRRLRAGKGPASSSSEPPCS